VVRGDAPPAHARRRERVGATLRRFAIDELGWGKRRTTVRVDACEPGEKAQIELVPRPRSSGRIGSRYQFVYPAFDQTMVSVCEGFSSSQR